MSSSQSNDFSHHSSVFNKPVHVIAVTAGKGGVGKSTVSLNLAVCMAKQNKKILLLDADLGLANIDIMLGLHTKYDLSHVIEGQCHLNDIILAGPENISVIPASSGIVSMTSLSKAEHAGIINSFNEIIEDLDYMIIDTAAGISDTVLSFACSSQEVLVVISDEPTSIIDAYALIKVMHQLHDWTQFNVLTNMVREKGNGKLAFEKLYQICDDFLDVNLHYYGEIPLDEKVHLAVMSQEPVLSKFPESEASKAFHKLSELVISSPGSNQISGKTSFFLERLVSSENRT